MKRRTAIRLFEFLIIMQVIGFVIGTIGFIFDMVSGSYKYLPAYVVGYLAGYGLFLLWFRQLRQVKATSEEEWNRAWFITPSNKP